MSSPIVHISILVSILNVLTLLEIDWRTLSISIIPTILGFSLAAYAITFTLMGGALHNALSAAHDSDDRPLFISINATFFHNLLFQIACLSFAALSKGTFIARVIERYFNSGTAVGLIKFEVGLGNAVGSFLISYAILLLLSSAVAMFRLGRLSYRAGGRTRPIAPANDGGKLETPPPAGELYGIRWAIIRGLARILRVKG